MEYIDTFKKVILSCVDYLEIPFNNYDKLVYLTIFSVIVGARSYQYSKSRNRTVESAKNVSKELYDALGSPSNVTIPILNRIKDICYEDYPYYIHVIPAQSMKYLLGVLYRSITASSGLELPISRSQTYRHQTFITGSEILSLILFEKLLLYANEREIPYLQALKLIQYQGTKPIVKVFMAKALCKCGNNNDMVALYLAANGALLIFETLLKSQVNGNMEDIEYMQYKMATLFLDAARGNDGFYSQRYEQLTMNNEHMTKLFSKYNLSYFKFFTKFFKFNYLTYEYKYQFVRNIVSFLLLPSKSKYIILTTAYQIIYIAGTNIFPVRNYFWQHIQVAISKALFLSSYYILFRQSIPAFMVYLGAELGLSAFDSDDFDCKASLFHFQNYKGPFYKSNRLYDNFI